MKPVKVAFTVKSTTVTLPELEPYIGRMVRIVVSDPLDPQPGEPLETEETMFALAPKMTPEEEAADLEELRKMAEADPKIMAVYQAYLAVKDDPNEAYDVDAVLRSKGVR